MSWLDRLLGKEEKHYNVENIQPARNVPRAPTQQPGSTGSGFYNTFGSWVSDPGTFYYQQKTAAYKQQFFDKYPNFYADAIVRMNELGMSEAEAMQASIDNLDTSDRRDERFLEMFHSGRLTMDLPGGGGEGAVGGASGGGGMPSITRNGSRSTGDIEIDTSTAQEASDSKRQRR